MRMQGRQAGRQAAGRQAGGQAGRHIYRRTGSVFKHQLELELEELGREHAGVHRNHLLERAVVRVRDVGVLRSRPVGQAGDACRRDGASRETGRQTRRQTGKAPFDARRICAKGKRILDAA